MKNEKELDELQGECFPTLKPSQCAIFSHRFISSNQKSKLKLTNKVLTKANFVHTCLDQDPDSLRNEFNDVNRFITDSF